METNETIREIEIVSNRNIDIVDFLLKRKFHTLTYEDKLIIKQLTIPRPQMRNLMQSKSGHNRSFVNTWYDKVVWITGSESQNKLFCWYCLLFSSENAGSWTTVGFDNLKDLSRATKKHEKSKEHTHSALKFKLFGKQNIVNALDSARPQFIVKHNEMVRENRLMIKHLIYMILYLSKNRRIDLIYKTE